MRTIGVAFILYIRGIYVGDAMPHEITTKNVIIVNDKEAWRSSSFGGDNELLFMFVIWDGDFHNITYQKGSSAE